MDQTKKKKTGAKQTKSAKPGDKPRAPTKAQRETLPPVGQWQEPVETGPDTSQTHLPSDVRVATQEPTSVSAAKPLEPKLDSSSTHAKETDVPDEKSAREELSDPMAITDILSGATVGPFGHFRIGDRSKDRRLEILRRQTGTSMIEDPMTDRSPADPQYEDVIRDVATNMPQSAFDKLASTLIELQMQPKSSYFGAVNPENLPIDRGAQQFNIDDLASSATTYHHPLQDGVSIYAMLRVLTGTSIGELAPCVHSLAQEYAKIIDKTLDAAQRAGVPIYPSQALHDIFAIAEASDKYNELIGRIAPGGDLFAQNTTAQLSLGSAGTRGKILAELSKIDTHEARDLISKYIVSRLNMDDESEVCEALARAYECRERLPGLIDRAKLENLISNSAPTTAVEALRVYLSPENLNTYRIADLSPEIAEKAIKLVTDAPGLGFQAFAPMLVEQHPLITAARARTVFEAWVKANPFADTPAESELLHRLDVNTPAARIDERVAIADVSPSDVSPSDESQTQNSGLPDQAEQLQHRSDQLTASHPIYQRGLERQQESPFAESTAPQRIFKLGDQYIKLHADEQIPLGRNLFGISDSSVSRSHATIGSDANGIYITENPELPSSNGTFVNGEAVVPGMRRYLGQGDAIKLGASWLEFQPAGALMKLPRAYIPSASAIEQSNYHAVLQKTVRPIEDGFQDAGQNVTFDNAGRPLSDVNRAVILKDRNQDPVLREVIADVKQRFGKLEQRQQAEALLRYTNALLRPRNLSESQLDDWYRDFNSVHKEKQILLGDFIRNGKGVCSQQALLYKVLVDELGLPVSYVSGTGSEESPASLNHAWNTVTFDDASVIDINHNRIPAQEYRIKIGSAVKAESVIFDVRRMVQGARRSQIAAHLEGIDVKGARPLPLRVGDKERPILLPDNYEVSIGRYNFAEGESIAAVSRNHASLKYHDGILSVRDNGSLNGTWVNGERLTAGQSYDVTRSDTIRFGQYGPKLDWLKTPEKRRDVKSDRPELESASATGMNAELMSTWSQRIGELASLDQASTCEHIENLADLLTASNVSNEVLAEKLVELFTCAIRLDDVSEIIVADRLSEIAFNRKIKFEESSLRPLLESLKALALSSNNDVSSVAQVIYDRLAPG